MPEPAWLARWAPLPEAIFEGAAAHVLALEGGHVDDPDDRGGETRYGISSRAHPDVDLDSLTARQAIEIYRHDYWQRPHIDRVPEPAIAARLLALAVVAGPVVAVRALQLALGRLGLPVAVDGRLGPATLEAVAEAHRPGLLAALIVEEVAHYVAICRARERNRKYLLGWLRRALA